MKDKQWKDYWDVDTGVSYIPHEKLDPHVNLVELEEGGMFDEETMPDWIRAMRGATGMTPAPVMQHTPQQFMPEMKQLPGPPPGFVRIPEGMSPAMVGQSDPTHIPVPGAPPPGMPPFGLPPGLAAQAGLLQGAAMLSGAAGLLGAPGGPRLVGPPGILLPRFGLPHQPPPMAGHPPPGFLPPFDISQPPPGLRPPFPHLGAPAVISEAGSDDMDIDQDVTPTPITRERHRSGERDRRDRNRESRWNRDEKPSAGGDEGLLSRLRNIAGHEQAGPVEPAQSKPDIWESGPPSRGK